MTNRNGAIDDLVACKPEFANNIAVKKDEMFKPQIYGSEWAEERAVCPSLFR